MNADGVNGGRLLISYEELAEIDLDALDHLSGDELRSHFRELACRASEGQLREALAIPHDGDLVKHSDLVESYATRRQATALKLRSLREIP